MTDRANPNNDPPGSITSPVTGGWWRYVLYRPVYIRSLKIAAAVGTVLVAVNFGDRLLHGTMPIGDWVKAALNYVVPYCVATYVGANAAATGRSGASPDIS
jgi:hypothetical protein